VHHRYPLSLLALLFAGTLWGQAVQRKHLLIALGGGGATMELTGPADSLRMQPTNSGVVHFSFAYALGDRWSLGLRFDRIGTEEQVEPMDRMRVNSFLLQGAYRPWIARRAALEVHLALGTSVISVDPENELLPVTANPGAVLYGVRFIQLLGGTMGLYAALERGVSNSDAAKFSEQALLDAEAKPVMLSWKATRATVGLVVRF
jgi:hypothetical protein